ncbi:MAG: 23S rRNA (guanosine(2251)-2'-O)-methyltransferase RlmB [Alkalispirochaetaceae bacterium]
MITQKHAIEEHIRSGGGGVLYVSRQARSADPLASLDRVHGIEVRTVSPQRMKRLNPKGGSVCFEESSQEGRTPDFDSWLKEHQEGRALVLLLDHVTDPHNLGATLRSAEQLGVDLVVLPQRRAAGLGGVVADTSAGAVKHVPVTSVANLANSVAKLKDAGFWVYGAQMSGNRLWDVDFSERAVFLLGSEGKGLSELLQKRSDELVAIPRYGRIDSLNVSVAAGIVLYEYRRQHP